MLQAKGTQKREEDEVSRRASNAAFRAFVRNHRETDLGGYETRRGRMFEGDAESLLDRADFWRLQGRVQLIFTSPPFPLKRKKRYGNLQGDAFVDWFAAFAPKLKNLLAPNGSIVIEMGNAWEQGRPIMSTLGLRALLKFLEAGQFVLCQQLICHNSARLPGPAQWVNLERIRLTDAFTHIWWMSAIDKPDADNRRVLKKYSPAMLKLLKTQKYNAGLRPSEHRIGEKSFLKNNAGAIPSNVLTFANTAAIDPYLNYCRSLGKKPHPARMPAGLPEFFIKFLTQEDDLVLDPFGGSNTTGAAAERLGRRWIAFEKNPDYIEDSKSRFSKFSAEIAAHVRRHPANAVASAASAS